uniref:Uncharacterized protein n=1 Tax=Strigamia maritima TaxID=126957 RepID=T1IYW8_STRMM
MNYNTFWKTTTSRYGIYFRFLLNMLMFILSVVGVGVGSSFATRDNNTCFDPQKLVDKSTTIHPGCRAEVSDQAKADPKNFNCTVAYILYDRCHDEGFGIVRINVQYNNSQ